MKLAAFDLEIAKEVEGEDWQLQRPLGISCAAAAWHPRESSKIWNSLMWFAGDDFTNQPWSGAMTGNQCRKIVKDLQDMVADGATIVTVNGLGFDFAILAEESGMVEECADLALNHHCDLMLMSVCYHGWPVGLDALAAGAGVEGKLHQVALNDGTLLDGMGGAMAPRMWAQGEYEAVLAYLKDDVRATLETAVVAVKRSELRWKSKKGRGWGVDLLYSGDTAEGHPICRLPTVSEMLAWERPDTSWMDNPMNPDELAAWAKQPAHAPGATADDGTYFDELL
jgi:hypothetical protein